MKEAINFLRTIYADSVADVANILTAEADGNKVDILAYLIAVKKYTEELIDKLMLNL